MSPSKDNDQLEIRFGNEADQPASSSTPSATAARGETPTAPVEAADAGAAEDDGRPPAHDRISRLFDLNFMQYASYVIRERAIPELSDGLKPVQRRIMYALHEKDDGKFIKVANIVGHTMQYHPHGDASIGDALVGLVNRRYLIEGQGNFGNPHTGDSAAAPRYIECRLTELARQELFNDDLTEFIPTYDGRNKEPVTLPSRLPLLLMLGAEGIAVGLATRIMPHNFKELIEAQIAILQNRPFKVLPDFLQGGLMDVSEYDDGVGRIRLRAVIEERDAQTLLIRQVPFGATTESLIASIEDAARKKKIKIRSIQDYTAESVEIAIALAPGESAPKTVKALYAFTACESATTGNPIVIRDRRPVEMRVSDILRANTEQLVILLRRNLELDRDRWLEKLQAKTLEQIFIEKRIYQRIETCKTHADVRQTVFDGVNVYRKQLRRDVTDADVDRLLELHIRRISLYDIERNRSEIAAVLKSLAETEKDLKRLTPFTVRYLQRLLKEHGADYPRRTKITKFDAVNARELTARDLSVNYDKSGGYLGFNVTGDNCLVCSSFDKLLLAWDDGRYKVINPPEKLFVDKNLLYCTLLERDRVMTAVYSNGQVTYAKRFTFGGAIMNKEYGFAPPKSRVLLLSDNDPETLYAVYTPAKNQRIHQQMFAPREMPVKSVKARGNQMTIKKIRTLSATKPRNWDDTQDTPPGRLIK